MTTTAKLIGHWRKRQQQTLEDLADKIGVTRQAVSLWERGISAPSVANLERLIEEGFELRLWQFYGKGAVQGVSDEKIAA